MLKSCLVNTMNKKPAYLTYFQTRAFDRLFRLFREKYYSLGRYSGTVKMTNLTKEESKDLSLFFGRTYQVGETITISFKQFEQVMMASKYQMFDWTTLLECYFDQTLKTKQECLEQAQNQEAYFFHQVLQQVEPGLGKQWLEDCIDTRSDTYQYLRKRYRNNANTCKMDLHHIVNLVNYLSVHHDQVIALPMLAGTITKNPHYLDLGTKNSHLFLRALADTKGISYPKEHQEKINFLSEWGIYTDSLSNTVITNGLFGSPLFQTFYNQRQPLTLNLENLLTIDSVDTEDKKVFIFENPSILNTIRDQKLSYPVVITSGIPNLAVYQLLDKLVKSHNHLYYNGDYDPEGMMIADKLKRNYGEHLTLFQYDEQDYQTCKSNEVITDRRLKKLDTVQCPELAKIKQSILIEKKAAYQEKNMEAILTYIKEQIT